MKPEHWEKVAQLHRATLNVEKGRRAAFLQEECAGTKTCVARLNRCLLTKGKPRTSWSLPPSRWRPNNWLRHSPD